MSRVVGRVVISMFDLEAAWAYNRLLVKETNSTNRIKLRLKNASSSGVF